MTSFFTTGGGRQHNCLMALPHGSTDRSTIKKLDNKFIEWWKKAKVVPSEPLKRPSKDKKKSFLEKCTLFLKENKVTSGEKDYLFRGLNSKNVKKITYLTEEMRKSIFKKKKCVYYLMIKACNDTKFIDQVESGLNQGSTFKILLKNKLIVQNGQSYRRIVSLAKDNPDLIQLKSKNRSIKHIILIRDPQVDGVCGPRAFIAYGSLTHQSDKYTRPGIQFTDKDSVAKLIKDFESIWVEAKAVP